LDSFQEFKNTIIVSTHRPKVGFWDPQTLGLGCELLTFKVPKGKLDCRKVKTEEVALAKILVINPGSTSTKVALFEDENKVAEENVIHDSAKLSSFAKTADQAPYRLEAILDFMTKHGWKESDLDCVVGRGGPVRSIPAGTYKVNEKLLTDLIEAKRADHPSNLGGVLADSIAKKKGIPAFIVDPVSVDEFPDVARIAGMAECERVSLGHALNIRAVSRKTAEEMGKKLEDCNFVVAHMGGGISVSPVLGGKIVDTYNSLEGGPMTPERSGAIPLASLVELCINNNLTENDIKIMTTKKGGISAHLATNDVREVLALIEKGDKKAELVLEAMISQISQEIGEASAAIKGKVDRIVLTGSIAYSPVVTGKIEAMTSWIAPIARVPGQMEMEALALGGLRVLRGQEQAKEY
jgi:butyrate kinase